MYDVEVHGETRSAGFVMDVGMHTLTRTQLILADDSEGMHGDVLEVHISDRDSPSNMTVAWIVLWGDKVDIIETIQEKIPMAKLETEAIFDAFKEDELETSVCYTYPLDKAMTHIMKKSKTYQSLCAAQRSIVASMWGLEADQVRVLDNQNS